MAKVKIIFTHAREEGILPTHKDVGLSQDGCSFRTVFGEGRVLALMKLYMYSGSKVGSVYKMSLLNASIGSKD